MLKEGYRELEQGVLGLDAQAAAPRVHHRHYQQNNELFSIFQDGIPLQVIPIDGIVLLPRPDDMTSEGRVGKESEGRASFLGSSCEDCISAIEYFYLFVIVIPMFLRSFRTLYEVASRGYSTVRLYRTSFGR